MYTICNIRECVMLKWNFELSLKVFEFEKMCQNRNYKFLKQEDIKLRPTPKKHPNFF